MLASDRAARFARNGEAVCCCRSRSFRVLGHAGAGFLVLGVLAAGDCSSLRGWGAHTTLEGRRDSAVKQGLLTTGSSHLEKRHPSDLAQNISTSPSPFPLRSKLNQQLLFLFTLNFLSTCFQRRPRADPLTTAIARDAESVERNLAAIKLRSLSPKENMRWQPCSPQPLERGRMS